MTSMPIAIDTSVLVALLDARDTWHTKAIALRDAFASAECQLVYFDCVIIETVGVIARRTSEQKRSDQFAPLLDSLLTLVSAQQITWLAAAYERLFARVLALCRTFHGSLNFNDAIIALACQELNIRHIASFDADFDGLELLTRLAGADEVLGLAE